VDTLTPNTPAKRLQFIAKTYERRPYLVLDMIDIIALTVGEDEWRTQIRRAAEADESFAADVKLWIAGSEWASNREPSVEFVDTVATLAQELPGFRRRSPVEGMFPWMATQLAKALKDAERRHRGRGITKTVYTGHEYAHIMTTFKHKGTALGQWFQDVHPNLTKLSFEEAMEEFKGWEEEQVDEDEEIPQGEIVYEFKDGWTVQELETEEQLDAEGDIMQHCVAGYCDAVKAGTTTIYSVRDPKGRPHVTIEFDPDLKFVKQTQGKQNDKPAPKYQKYVDEFLASGTLPEMDPATKAAYEALEKHDGDDDEYMRHEVRLWVEEFGHDAAEWIDMGFREANEAAALRDADVPLDEIRHWPSVLWERWGRGDIQHNYRGEFTVDAWARLVRIAMMIYLSEREKGASGAARAYAKQTSFPFAKEDAASIARLADESEWAWEFGQWGHKDEDEEEEWAPILVQAERWAGTDLDLDDIEGWYKEYFRPSEAEAWEEAGVDPEVAAILRMERVTPEQVERAVEAGRLQGRWPSDLKDADKILDAVGITPNRRRWRA
jgi:hypothetical protein